MLNIRQLTADDITVACDIVAQHNATDAAFARRAFAREVNGSDRSRHVVAEMDGTVVGVSGWMTEGPQGLGVFWLGWTYVDRDHRRQGIATALLAHVVNDLRGRGARKLYLDTGARGYEEAVSFYMRQGFVEEARLTDYYADGEHCLIMTKRV